jgi:hypothetical protein
VKNLARRLRNLEAARFDSSGLVPQSEAWFAYYTDLLGRNMDGEDIQCDHFPIEVIDRLVALADRADQEQRG